MSTCPFVEIELNDARVAMKKSTISHAGNRWDRCSGLGSTAFSRRPNLSSVARTDPLTASNSDSFRFLQYFLLRQHSNEDQFVRLGISTV